ncbi:unnamed protein product [Fusarium graminearum]|nr:hypothetical protein FG05_30506 [Fusarium graminearum]CAG2001477.1 unnamed protein product [Fusarium graminearum]VTO91927.1 unnamed protein product [Fusarium graminearum]
MGNAVSVVEDIGRGASEVVKQIETGVGAVGQSIGDVFYPDNPNRRDRVDQLQNDIKAMKNEFEGLKKTMEKQLRSIQDKLDELLKANNFENFDQMDAHMQKTLHPQLLAEWNAFKQTLNRDIAIENMILTATGLITIAAGFIAYGLAFCGAITFASAGTALEIAGAVALVLVTVFAILAIVDAHQERQHLQDAIRKLAFARVEAKQALEQMRTYTGFLGSFEMFLSSKILSKDPTDFNEFTNGSFITSLEAIVWPKVAQMLRELDDNRKEHAWRNEDPDVSSPGSDHIDRVAETLKKYKDNNRATTANSMPMAKMASMQTLSLVPESFNTAFIESNIKVPAGDEQPLLEFVHEKMAPDEVVKPHQFRLNNFESFTDCVCEDVDNGETWRIHAKMDMKPSTSINIKDVRFSITNMTKGITFNDARINLLGYA